MEVVDIRILEEGLGGGDEVFEVFEAGFGFIAGEAGVFIVAEHIAEAMAGNVVVAAAVDVLELAIGGYFEDLSAGGDGGLLVLLGPEVAVWDFVAMFPDAEGGVGEAIGLLEALGGSFVVNSHRRGIRGLREAERLFDLAEDILEFLAEHAGRGCVLEVAGVVDVVAEAVGADEFGVGGD